jgi:hypothetical protein
VSGPLLGEAVGVLFVTCRALALWVIAAAFVATVCLYTAILTGAWATRKAWRAARRGLYARLRPEVPAEAPRLLPTPERAADARSADRDRREAA